MSLIKDFELLIKKNNCENIDSFIKVLLLNYDENNYSQRYLDNAHIVDMYSFMINNDDDSNDDGGGDNNKYKIVKQLVETHNIIDNIYLKLILKNKKYMSILIDNVIEYINTSNSESFYKALLIVMLQNNYKIDKNLFFISAHNSDYINILKKYGSNYDEIFILCIRNIALQIKKMEYECRYDYRNKNNVQTRKQNIENLYSLFAGQTFDTEAFDMILSVNDKAVIKEIFCRGTIKSNITISGNYFEILLDMRLLNIIDFFINKDKDKISDLEKCYDYFLDFLKKTNAGQYNSNVNSISEQNDEKKYISNIFKYFINNQLFKQHHFDFFFTKRLFEFIDILGTNNYYPDSSNLKTFLNFAYVDNLNYFNNIQFTEEHLYLSCINVKENITKEILNQKIKPTKRCFLGLYEKNPSHNSIPKIIEYLIYYGYSPDESDVILTLNYNTKLNEDLIQKIFEINDTFKQTFYNYCTFDFMPKYSNNIYNDIYWLRKMCKVAKKADDYKAIKNFIKKEKINLDNLCYINLNMNPQYNREKAELLLSYEEFKNLS